MKNIPSIQKLLFLVYYAKNSKNDETYAEWDPWNHILGCLSCPQMIIITSHIPTSSLLLIVLLAENLREDIVHRNHKEVHDFHQKCYFKFSLYLR